MPEATTYVPQVGDRVRLLQDFSADEGQYVIAEGDLETVSEVAPEDLHAIGTLMFGGIPIWVQVDDKPLLAHDGEDRTDWALTSTEVEKVESE